ncbi:Nudix hydrolase 8 [Operophtera brumata]|uniref:Nudix hydrolase 8 n=1 Tax=Operophtera brumata TaxID=104452 RepID=A0A0L7KZX7_OPEBR|nr:Nudix hydrolase 8 [Operophtera brumata]
MEPIIFQGSTDKYNGVTVDSKKEACEIDCFTSRLAESLQKWKNENKRCIWFKVNIKDANWVPFLAKAGFNFHHSRDDFVMMYKWLPEDSSANLPPACHTNLGVGGEDMKDAAIREIKEETGIDAEFESMVTFRHSHNSMFGNSDIYAVVLLKATTDTIDKSETEIAACKWMDVEDFLNHPNVIDFNRFIVEQALDINNRKLKLDLCKGSVTVGNRTRDFTSLVLKD